jgi:phosphatidylinositol kinase/protein kinase (PI-3  family)
VWFALFHVGIDFWIFPNYFIDSFTDPQTFYQNKLNFIKTTAIWSISGYLIGLGDRHCDNIMINVIEGNFLHIDFGHFLGNYKSFKGII